jgi:DNA-binding protein HU-beta
MWSLIFQKLKFLAIKPSNWYNEGRKKQIGGNFMNKTELIARIAEVSGLTKKDSETALNSTLAAVQESLVAGEKVVLTGFGTFEVRDRKERVGHNPRTNEKINIPAQKSPAFKAGKVLKDAVR